MSQAQMFPITEEERITILRSNLAGDVERRKAKLDTAAAALGDAKEAYDDSLGLLDVFDRMVRERRGQHASAVGEVARKAAEIVNSGALDTEDLTVRATVGSDVDPVTGEVATAEWNERTCPQCGGEGRLPDRTGGGHHRCKKCNGTGDVPPGVEAEEQAP